MYVSEQVLVADHNHVDRDPCSPSWTGASCVIGETGGMRMRNPHQSKSTNKEDPESFSSSDNLRKTDSRIDDTKITWGITLISATVTKVSSSRSSHYLTLPQQSECLFAYQLMLSQLYPIFAAQKEKFSVSSHKISQTWNCGVIGKNVTGCRISGVSLPRQPRPPSNSARFTPEGDPEPGYKGGAFLSFLNPILLSDSDG